MGAKWRLVFVSNNPSLQGSVDAQSQEDAERMRRFASKALRRIGFHRVPGSNQYRDRWVRYPTPYKVEHVEVYLQKL